MRRNLWSAVLLITAAMFLFNGCTTVKKWAGIDKGEDDEESIPPEAQQETVMIDGKPYVRSKNPYWLAYPNQPEYIYAEKGKEFVGAQQYMIQQLARTINKERDKAAGKGIPPDKVQELVRQEVQRILQEQGLSGFVSRGKGERSPYAGRAVAVIPDLETSVSFEGLNRTLAASLADNLSKQKDVSARGPDQIREALAKAGISGKMTLAPNIRALGDALGVQGIVLTGIVPPEKGSEGFMVMEIYDTFMGTKAQGIVEPAGSGGLKAESAMKFAQSNALRVAGELLNMEWFGRVEFMKDGKAYLSLGQNAGLKSGDRLRVVSPGKEVVNPTTHAVLGYTADVPQGEVKVTELLGNTGAVAQVISGGPFKPNDKVKGVR